ncbi:MAG: TetR/AcrR family transcriptional regulator [Chloroflexaceae bacterium]|nr:TetR/AcrR family transcriptional regulator [Chloroflexaceae bacterium]NJL32712.1 TetR/AcrR family transcriptional regulator [Chloroflexaceae bacterium]NJO04988.1 TetR/AcrR family transcriptional regulator [Chloroflexaceae bacterium]
MPRTDQQLAELREESRTRILQGAMELFARYGYTKTSVRMIADHTGIAQGLMYRYFASKEALLRAVLDSFMQQVAQILAEAGTASDPFEHLAQIIRLSFELIQQQPDSWQLFYAIRVQPDVVAGLHEEINILSVALMQQLEIPFRRASIANAHNEAAILFAIIDGVCQQYVINRTIYPLQAVTTAVLAKYSRATLTGATSQ